MIRLPAFLFAALLLAGCEARIGTDGANEAGSSAAGKSERGTLSIDAPGFDLKLAIPKAVQSEIEGDSDIIYPGATMSGLHLAAETSAGSGAVELRFTSADAVDKVAAWYRDPARAADLKIASARRQGDAVVLSGTTAENGDERGPFTLRLSPDAGGTEGVLTLRDRTG